MENDRQLEKAYQEFVKNGLDPREVSENGTKGTETRQIFSYRGAKYGIGVRVL